MSQSKGRKIIPQRKNTPKKIDPSSVVLLPSVENMLSDALSVIGNELARLRSKSERTVGSLTPPEAKVLQGYVRSLVELSKESREREKEDDLSEISDHEILEALLQDMDEAEVQDLFRKTLRKKEKSDEGKDK